MKCVFKLKATPHLGGHQPSVRSCLTPCCPHGHHTGKDPQIEGRYCCSLNPKEIHTTHLRVGCHGHEFCITTMCIHVNQ